MILLKLYFLFLRIGLLNFGGGNGITTIVYNEIIQNKHWITKEELTNIVAISRITPGPIAANIATYIGMKTSGITGAIITTIALITPSIIILTMIMSVLHKQNFLNYYLNSLRPVIIALWIITIIILIEGTLFDIETDKVKILKKIALIGFNFLIILFYSKISPALLIIISGILYIMM